MSISLSSSDDDDEKYIDKDFLDDIDKKIALSGGKRTIEPLSKGGGNPLIKVLLDFLLEKQRLLILFVVTAKF